MLPESSDALLMSPARRRGPLLVPNLPNYTGLGKSDLLDSTYPLSTRLNLFSSGIFTFDTITFVYFPTRQTSTSQPPWAWTVLPGLRRIVFKELPEQEEDAPELARWLEEALLLQPELVSIEIDIAFGSWFDYRDPERERVRALTTLPWLGHLEFLGEQDIAHWSTWNHFKFSATKDGIVSAAFPFGQMKGIPPFLHASGLNLPNLTTLEVAAIRNPFGVSLSSIVHLHLF